ncbi:MAG: hypothetical protein HY718_13550, partial [Planctomycetes bacterium]|nr:hypothetical protein [Planctomycetota bacterium]
MRQTPWRCAALVVVFATWALGGNVTILDWNILTYNDPGTNEYNALVRIVQAINPDIILVQEANHSTGRSAFMAAFAARYPYSFLGAPNYENPRNQILSAYPLTATGQNFIPDPNGGTFERPTIWADVNVATATPEAELRVYSAHFKSGSASRDWTLKNNQATADANSIASLLSSNPAMRVYYAGDLNCTTGTSPINTLLAPQTTLARLDMRDPRTNGAGTHWTFNTIIDHAFRSATLGNSMVSYYIFDTTTIPFAQLPPPTQSGDSHTASDHLALVSTITIGDVDPSDQIRINEVFVRQQTAPDTNEFIELSGPPGADLTGLAVVIVEGDDPQCGTVDRIWSLTGQTLPAGGYFLMGGSALNPDMNLGTSNLLENGTQTILLVQGVLVSVGQDIDTNNDGVADVPIGGGISDAIAVTDGGPLDRTYFDAPVLGPVGGLVPGGAARCPDKLDTDSAGDFKLLSPAMD